MSHKNARLLKAALSAIHYTRADEFLRPLTRGAGAIFTRHHVRPEAPGDFEPNRLPKITSTFLEAVLREDLEAGFEIDTLDRVAEQLRFGSRVAPFRVLHV
jgi:hypothetical protein